MTFSLLIVELPLARTVGTRTAKLRSTRLYCGCGYKNDDKLGILCQGEMQLHLIDIPDILLRDGYWNKKINKFQIY